MTEPARAQRAIVSPVPRSSAPKPKSDSDSQAAGVAPRETVAGPDVKASVPAVADSATAPAAPAPVYNEWQPIDTAPHDGRALWLGDGKGNTCEAVWRPSRQFGMEKNAYGKWIGRWTPGGFWSIHNFAGVKIPFAPKVWHK